MTEHSPSIDLALSLATAEDAARGVDVLDASTPSGLAHPVCRERRSATEEALGPVVVSEQCFSVGGDVSLEVDWLVPSQEAAAPPEHLHYVDLKVGEERLRVRRGQLMSLRKALEMAEYLFEAQEREDLGRHTC